MKRFLTPIILSCALTTTANAQTIIDATWNIGEGDQIEAGWCTGATDIGRTNECHNVVCHNGQLYYSLFFEDIKRPNPPLGFTFFVDGEPRSMTDHFHQDFASGTKRGFRSNNPIPAKIVQDLMAGSVMTMTRLGSKIKIALNGSGSSIKRVLDLCQQQRQPALQPDRVATLCKPFLKNVRFSGERFIGANRLDQFYHDVTNRYGNNQPKPFAQRRFFPQGRDGEKLASTLQIGRFVVQVFSDRYSGGYGQKAQTQFQDIQKVTAKYFEWREIAKKNGVTELKKTLPLDLTGGHWFFKVEKNYRTGSGSAYFLNDLDETGMCWMYQQVTTQLQADLPQVQATFKAREASAAQQQRQQQNINSQFQ